jgi:hypothetical protein
MNRSPSAQTALLCVAALSLAGCARTSSTHARASGAQDPVRPVVERVGPGGDFSISLGGEQAFSTAVYGNAAECRAGYSAFLKEARPVADLSGLEADDWDPCTASELPGGASPPTDEPVSGGLVDQDPAGPGVATAANVAMYMLREKTDDPSLELVAIRRARTQVVKGTNYYLALDLRGTSGPQSFDVTVYQSLGSGGYQLTSWEASAATAAGGVLVSLQNGDAACYVEVEGAGGLQTHHGDFDLCQSATALIGAEVALEFGTGRVIAPSCQGDPECPDSIEVQLVVGITAR